MNESKNPEEKIPDLAKKFFYSALGGILVSLLESMLRRILPEDASANLDLITNVALILIIGVLFLRKEHLNVVRGLKRWKAWRLVNSFILLGGLFAPWFKACNRQIFTEEGAVAMESALTFNGFDTLFLFGAFSRIGLGEAFFRTLPLIIVLLGIASIIAYIFLNLRKIVNQAGDDRWRIISLIISFVGMSVGIYTIADFENYLWGYWFSWLGLLLSGASELYAKQSDEFQ